MMATIPSGLGSRQQRAEQLRREMEDRNRQVSDAMNEKKSRKTEDEQSSVAGTGEYVVGYGECCSSIALKTGHYWQTIWEHPDNAEVRGLRKLPNVLKKGDRLHIPEKQPKTESGEAEMRHRFVRRGEPSWFRVTLLQYDCPRSNQKYIFDADGAQRPGCTDPDGKVDEPIRGSTRIVKLIFGETEDDREVLVFDLGGLEPITEIAGVQARLSHLGFDPGPVGGKINEATRAALLKFQEKNGLPTTGEPDEETRAELVKQHGS